MPNGAASIVRIQRVGYLKLARLEGSGTASSSEIMQTGPPASNSGGSCRRQPQVRMIARTVAPAAPMMLLYRPKFKFLRFQMTVDFETEAPLASAGFDVFSDYRM
jgi:hypothetical protein